MLCNLLAVTIFWPAVYAVYTEYIERRSFDHPSRWVKWCLSPCKKQEPAKKVAHSQPPLVRFFAKTWAPAVIRFAPLILLVFGGVFGIGIWLTTRLAPDQKTPNTIPAGNNYHDVTDVLLQV